MTAPDRVAPGRAALGQVREWAGTWGVPHAAAAVLTPGGVVGQVGEGNRRFALASVTKLLTTYAVLVAVEEGAVELDDPAGPPGSTVRHLLAHAAGYGFDAATGVVAPPGTRRVYSNRGMEVLAEHLVSVTGIPFAVYLQEAVLQPLGMPSTQVPGSPAAGGFSTMHDLTRFGAELLAPRLLGAATLAEAVAVQLPGLTGVLPGLGRFDPLDWGLGFERSFGRERHWAGTAVSEAAFGHFGAAGTFLWVDPQRSLCCICLTDLDFGPWARAAWPPFCDAVVAEYASPVTATRAEGDAGRSST